MDKSLIAGTIVITVILILIIIIILVKQNKAGLYHGNNGNIRDAMGKGMGIGVSIGAGTGVAIGVALGDVAIGIAIGSGIGLSIGAALGATFKRNEEKEKGLNRNLKSSSTDRNERLPVVLGIVVLLFGLLMAGLFFFMKMN